MDKFFADQAKRQSKGDAGHNNQAKEVNKNGDGAPAELPKGVVLGKDGKPCRTCTSSAEWAAMMKGMRGPERKPTAAKTAVPNAAPSTSSDCPPDVETLGNHTWTLLHTISASYPEQANSTQQSEMKQFISLFSKLYPCWVCADDFREWMHKPGNEPRVEGREKLGRWMCEAHNEVNVKLGKQTFDCSKWAERWKDGWKDGRCD
ncbi:hypothetical protein MMC25_003677 [Agyrium rufum]|nr:hypothetical protein [Agyrium rufum]